MLLLECLWTSPDRTSCPVWRTHCRAHVLARAGPCGCVIANLELPGNASLRNRTRAFHECIALIRGLTAHDRHRRQREPRHE